MKMTGLAFVLGLGWLGHAAFWIRSLRRAARAAAAPGEYLRELTVRFVMLALILLTLILPRGRLFPYGRAIAYAGVAIFLLGQVLAVLARLQLGSRWGIGISPRAGGADPGKNGRFEDGLFGVVRHPIYIGTVLAIFVQALIVQNVPSFLLLAAALGIVFWKAREEDRRLAAKA